MINNDSTIKDGYDEGVADLPLPLSEKDEAPATVLWSSRRMVCFPRGLELLR
ncbi:MAG: hypothetical protein ACJAVK_000842 [Akkermansiaceae bacterium]|jgi:hypothetical protein